jgi:hypothetical protein
MFLAMSLSDDVPQRIAQKTQENDREARIQILAFGAKPGCERLTNGKTGIRSY